MNKKLIRLTENDLHKIVKESVNRTINEVALKGKSGKTYSLHGNDEESWDIVSRLRQKKSGNSNYNTMRDEKNAEEIDAKNHPNRRSLNNANRVNASLKRTSNASKDIMAANESFIRKIVKESVNKVLKENTNDDTEIRWGKYERLVDQIRNATQELYMTTSNQYANAPSYDETEGRLHRFAESVLSVLEKFDFVDYGFDPTQHITW